MPVEALDAGGARAGRVDDPARPREAAVAVAELEGRLDRDDLRVPRLEADRAVERGVEGERGPLGRQHGDAADLDDRRPPHLELDPQGLLVRRDVAAVGEDPDAPPDRHRAVVARVERAADRRADVGADARGDGMRDRRSVDHRHQASRLDTQGEEALEDVGAVAGRPRPRAVRGLGQDERAALRVEGPADGVVHGQEVGGEAPPPLPGLPGELTQHRLDLGGAPGAVGDGHDGEAGVGDVEPRLDREQRDGEDAGPRLETLGLRHQPGHGLVIGALALGRHQHGGAREERDGVDLSPHGPEEEGGGLRAGLVEVDVGVRVVADQGVGLPDHAGRDGGVKVQRGDQGNGGAEGLADRGEELALAVRRVLEHHRAVEREEHAVDGPRRGQPLEERVPHVIEGGPRHRPRRDRVGRDRRDHLDAGGLQHVEKAAHLGPRAPEARDHLVSVEKLGRPEVLEIRTLADEGVGLLHELPDRNPHRRHHSQIGVRP